MGDYKKSKEHLTNAALASPLAFLAGGPVGALSVLGLGKLIDHLEDKDFERRQEEWLNNPHRYIQPTMEEIVRKNQISQETTVKINDLNEIKTAKKIRSCANWKAGHEKEQWVTVSGNAPLAYTRTGIGDGEVLFHLTRFSSLAEVRVPAKLYYNETDFLDRFNSDYRYHPNMEIYKFEPAQYKQGHWMYTMDGGKSYVVGL